MLYFMCITNSNRTEPSILFRFLTYVNMNFLFKDNYANNYYSTISPVDYQSKNETFTKLIILGIISLPIFLNLIKILKFNIFSPEL